ncbi:protein Wnt-7b [Trichonephila clavipes]|nr:protein Wnt-7b [Trichonephila clavipes]
MTNTAAFTASIICSKIPGLTPAQQRLCQERPDLIVAVGDGARMGIAECQKQFRYKRWNCTAIGSSYVFGHVVIIALPDFLQLAHPTFCKPGRIDALIGCQ